MYSICVRTTYIQQAEFAVCANMCQLQVRLLVIHNRDYSQNKGEFAGI
jgi:hypothetical protein